MVVTRRKPVVPTPGPASRTSSTQAVPHTAKPKATQSGLPNSSALEHANGSEKQAKKAKSPAHKGKKKKKRDRSVLTYLRNILLTLTTIYAILACPDSPLYTSDSSPFHIPSHPSTTQRNLPITPFPATIFPPPHPLICKTLLTTHNKLVLPLQTYVIAPLYSQASQAVYHVAHSPAFAPYTTSASSFYETKLAPVYSDYLSPFWRQYIVPQYHRYVAPVLADRVLPFINNSITPTWKYRIVPTYQRYYAKLVLPYWRKYVSRPLTPYVASLQSAYERHLAPIVSRLERVSWNIYKVLVKAWKNAEPHVGRAIKGLGRLFSTIYARLEPHLRIFLKKASSQSSEALKWVWAQRRIYVDPHVKKIWVKVKELSGSDVKFDAPANGNGSRVDRDRSSALKSDSKAETVTSALSVAQESHAFVSRIPTSSTNSAEDRPPTSASSIEPTGEPSATSALEDNDSLTVLNTDIPKSIPESEASIQAEYEAVVPEVLSDAAAIKAASVIEESLFAHSSSPSLQEPTVEAVLTPSPSSPSDVYPTPSSIPPELPLDPDGFMDLDEFLANLGLDQDLPVDSPASADPPSSADAVESTPSASAVSQPAPKKTNPADMDEEERREYMDAKRLDITSRHSRWESEVESLIEAKTTEVTQKVLKLREDGVHTVLEKDSAVQVRAEDMVKEGERLLKGIGSWVAAHKDAPYAKKSEVNADLQKEKDRDMDLFDKLVGKVQEKFRDKVGEIEDEVRVWYMGVRDAEIQEVIRVEREVQELAERAQSDIGLDYAWLDDVTYRDWQRYHDLVRRSERFSDIARSLQNGTHDASPEDPMLPALEDLRSEVQDIVNAFQARLRSHKQAAAELFDDKPLDTHEDDVAVEAGSDHAQAKLPVAVPSLGSHGIVEGQENRPSSDAIPPVLLGRSEDEVIAALGRAPAVQADGRSAHTESSDDTETSVTDASGTDEKLPLERQATAQVPEHVEL
ncbi:hypothetical protein AB1N83_004460 [Pleurotus pulmonarius]